MALRKSLALSLVALSAAFAAPSALAAEYDVNTTADLAPTRVDGLCGDPCSLRAAIDASNRTPSPEFTDVIVVPAGTYRLTIPGAGEDLDATGDLDVRDSVTIMGAGAGATIIDGGGLDRVFDVSPFPSDPTGDFLSLRGVTVQGGRGSSGGGGGIRTSGALGLRNVVVRANTALGGFGGGVGVISGVASFTRAGSLDTRDVTVSGNVAASGGGISLDGFTNATIEQSTISGNAAIGGGPITGDGGGIRSGGALVLRNSTVSINVASNLAGGLLNFKTAAIFSSTFAYNAAGGGNGLSIWNDEVTGVTAQNTIVTSVDPSRNCHGPVASLGHNIDSGNSCLFAAPGDLASTNPLLGALAPNGGATSTHALLPGSPAIDAGDDVLCPATDQRGVSRPQGPHCDIGSYERAALPFIHLEILVFLHIVDPSRSGLCPGPAASCVISPNGAEIRFFPPQQGDPATIFEQGKPVAACVTQEGVCDVSLPPGRYLAVVKIAGIEQKPFYDAELISTDGQKPELHFKRLVKKNG